jgi:hypothetical protein
MVAFPGEFGNSLALDSKRCLEHCDSGIGRARFHRQQL